MSTAVPSLERRVRLLQWLVDFSSASGLCQDFKANSSWGGLHGRKNTHYCTKYRKWSPEICSGRVFGFKEGIKNAQPSSMPCPCGFFEPSLEPFFLEAIVSLPWAKLLVKSESEVLPFAFQRADKIGLSETEDINIWHVYPDSQQKSRDLEKDIATYLVNTFGERCFEAASDVFGQGHSGDPLTEQQKASLQHYRGVIRALQLVNGPHHSYLSWTQLKKWKTERGLDFSTLQNGIVTPKSLLILNLEAVKFKGPGAESADQDLFEELVHRLYDLDCGVCAFATLSFFECQDYHFSNIIPDVKHFKGTKKRIVWRDREPLQSCESSLPPSSFQRLGALLVRGQKMLAAKRLNHI